jgi:ribose transport system substrate-binding protein
MQTTEGGEMRVILAIGAVTLGLTLAACGSSNSNNSSSSTTAGSSGASGNSASGDSSLNGKTVAYLAPSLDISYWQWVYSGVKEQAKKMGLKAVSYNANNSPGDQLSNINSAISAGADMISIGPVSSTSTPPVLAAAERGKVPISFAGIGPQPGLTNYTSSVTANNFDAGVEEGDFVCTEAKKLGGNKIGMLSLPQDRENAQKYLKGAKQSFQKGGCQLVQILQTHGLTVREAVQQANDLLTAHPDIKGIYGMYDQAGIGAAKALASRNLIGKVAVATADGSPTTVDLLEKGKIQGLMLQEAVGQGIETVKQNANALQGKPIQKAVPLKEPLVTTKNLCSAESQKVLRLTYPASAGSYGNC